MSENPDTYSEDETRIEARRMQRLMHGYSPKPETYDDAAKLVEVERNRRRKIFGNIDFENIIDKDTGGIGWERARRISTLLSEQVREDFPKSLNLCDAPIQPIIDKLIDTYQDDREASEIIHSTIKHRDLQHRVYDFDSYLHVFPVEGLYYIASFIKKKQLSEQDPLGDLRSILTGKKILVLGDDTGSLSEMLNVYGAEAYGIEYDEFEILLAQSGILSEDGSPQKQVIKGDIGDMTVESSPLLEKLQSIGPFDMIFSFAVFNYGSGIENAINNTSDEVPEYEKGESKSVLFQNNCQHLLKSGGLQLHLHVDMPQFFPYKYYLRDIMNKSILIPKKED